MLIFEVIESCCIDDLYVVVVILCLLCNVGVCIVLDDFGMGYVGLCQLQYMKLLLVDIFKIDKMFVDGLLDDYSMVMVIILMVCSFNL